MTLPHNAKMHYNYANFLRDSAKPELAKFHYRRALKLWPTYASAHNNLGTLLNNEQEAEQHFVRAIQYSADHVNAHYNLGQLYRKSNRTAESEHMLRRCISLDPKFTPAYVELARLRGPNDRRVNDLLKTVVSLNPDSSYYSTIYGHWLLDKGLYKDALTNYWHSLTISTKNQEAMRGVAKILRRCGQSSRLLQLITRWQLLLRIKMGSYQRNPNIYLHGWRLKNELSHKAEAYDKCSTPVYIEYALLFKRHATEQCVCVTLSGLVQTSTTGDVNVKTGGIQYSSIMNRSSVEEYGKYRITAVYKLLQRTPATRQMRQRIAGNNTTVKKRPSQRNSTDLSNARLRRSYKSKIQQRL